MSVVLGLFLEIVSMDVNVVNDFIFFVENELVVVISEERLDSFINFNSSNVGSN